MPVWALENSSALKMWPPSAPLKEGCGQVRSSVTKGRASTQSLEAGVPIYPCPLIFSYLSIPVAAVTLPAVRAVPRGGGVAGRWVLKPG